MPFPNYHSGRIEDPKQFTSFSYEKTDKGVDFVFGWKDNKSTRQAIRFDKKQFTPEEAKKWLKDHDIKYIKFEPALEENTFITFKEFLKENIE